MLYLVARAMVVVSSLVVVVGLFVNTPAGRGASGSGQPRHWLLPAPPLWRSKDAMHQPCTSGKLHQAVRFQDFGRGAYVHAGLTPTLDPLGVFNYPYRRRLHAFSFTFPGLRCFGRSNTSRSASRYL